jgi:hypothetical protein
MPLFPTGIGERYIAKPYQIYVKQRSCADVVFGAMVIIYKVSHFVFYRTYEGGGFRARICKPLRSPGGGGGNRSQGIDSASLCSLSVRAGPTTRVFAPARQATYAGGIDSLDRFLGSLNGIQIRAQVVVSGTYFFYKD